MVTARLPRWRRQAGVEDAKRFFGLGAVWSDFDNDGKLDLFVANDGEPNYLYHNEGGGVFKEIGYDAGVAVSEDGVEQANMGVALGDYHAYGADECCDHVTSVTSTRRSIATMEI